MKNKLENFQAKECTDVEIKMPWGYIAGKWWGPQTDRPILALHGWQDNAGTFDTLLPMFPSHIGILAIDLPGHGFSSPIPNGQMYHIVDFVTVVCMIMKDYNWEKVSFLGHSMGAIVGFQLAAIFPDKVDMLIGLDAYKPEPSLERNFASTMARLISGFLVTDERIRDDSEPPSYTYEECIEKLYVGSNSSIYREKCSYILNRNIKKSIKYPDKYYFNRDSRLKYIQAGVWPTELYTKLMNHIKCPVLFIRVSSTLVTDNLDDFRRDLAMLRKKPNFAYYEVDGSHHIHLNQPEKLIDYINQFLSNYKPVKSILKSKL